ncbi:hypothetical protein BGZ88_008368 [Linnemannia elongata]|nr:hypothetical protein BGZ88_008368 [Linnemannia elongata]
MLRSLSRAARPAAIALARSAPVVRANVGAFSAIRNYATAKPGMNQHPRSVAILLKRRNIFLQFD